MILLVAAGLTLLTHGQGLMSTVAGTGSPGSIR